MSFKKYYTAFEDLFFPRLCASCSKTLQKDEEVLCLKCIHHLPRTNFHLNPTNPVYEKFKGRIPVKMATSFIYFTKQSQAQFLIHLLKYKGKKTVGAFLGGLFATDLKTFHWLQNIDLLIPVPLHENKKKKRGYNQAEEIGKGITHISQIPIIEQKILIRTTHTESQTRKSGLERLKNVENVFHLLQPEKITGKNILLVDDVLTTGATLESCATELLKAQPAGINIATLAYASTI